MHIKNKAIEGYVSKRMEQNKRKTRNAQAITAHSLQMTACLGLPCGGRRAFMHSGPQGEQTPSISSAPAPLAQMPNPGLPGPLSVEAP